MVSLPGAAVGRLRGLLFSRFPTVTRAQDGAAITVGICRGPKTIMCTMLLGTCVSYVVSHLSQLKNGTGVQFGSWTFWLGR